MRVIPRLRRNSPSSKAPVRGGSCGTCARTCVASCVGPQLELSPPLARPHLHAASARHVPPLQSGASRRYRSAVQQRRAYFKGVDGFHWKRGGGSKRSVKLASEGELARRGLRHLRAPWLKMSGFILGMLHWRVGRQILSALIPSSRVSLGRGAGVGGWWLGGQLLLFMFVCRCALAVRSLRGVGTGGNS